MTQFSTIHEHAARQLQSAVDSLSTALGVSQDWATDAITFLILGEQRRPGFTDEVLAEWRRIAKETVQ